MNLFYNFYCIVFFNFNFFLLMADESAYKEHIIKKERINNCLFGILGVGFLTGTFLLAKNNRDKIIRGGWYSGALSFLNIHKDKVYSGCSFLQNFFVPFGSFFVIGKFLHNHQEIKIREEGYGKILCGDSFKDRVMERPANDTESLKKYQDQIKKFYQEVEWNHGQKYGYLIFKEKNKLQENWETIESHLGAISRNCFQLETVIQAFQNINNNELLNKFIKEHDLDFETNCYKPKNYFETLDDESNKSLNYVIEKYNNIIPINNKKENDALKEIIKISEENLLSDFSEEEKKEITKENPSNFSKKVVSHFQYDTKENQELINLYASTLDKYYIKNALILKKYTQLKKNIDTKKDQFNRVQAAVNNKNETLHQAFENEYNKKRNMLFFECFVYLVIIGGCIFLREYIEKNGITKNIAFIKFLNKFASSLANWVLVNVDKIYYASLFIGYIIIPFWMVIMRILPFLRYREINDLCYYLNRTYIYYAGALNSLDTNYNHDKYAVIITNILKTDSLESLFKIASSIN
jgi:hypothetical protein